MDGEEFYKGLRYEFDPGHNRDVKEAYIPVKIGVGEWTEFMNKVLTEVMRKEGFVPSTHIEEVPVIRGNCRGRVDHKWQKKNEIVLVEHENNILKVDFEIDNLLNSDGDLKVLITYSSDSSKRDELRKKLLQQLKEHRTNRKFEFLLIMGKDDDMNAYNDWEAFQYRPSFEEAPVTHLIPESSIK